MIKQENFDSFRIGIKYLPLVEPLSKDVSSTDAVESSTMLQYYSPADMFHYGIKIDETLIPTLKDEKINDSTVSENELFTEKRNYDIAVLATPDPFNRSSTIASIFKATSDAQEIYKELCKHHLQSTKAITEEIISTGTNQVRFFDWQTPSVTLRYPILDDLISPMAM